MFRWAEKSWVTLMTCEKREDEMRWAKVRRAQMRDEMSWSAKRDEVWSVECGVWSAKVWSAECEDCSVKLWSVIFGQQSAACLVLHCNVSPCVSWPVTKTVQQVRTKHARTGLAAARRTQVLIDEKGLIIKGSLGGETSVLRTFRMSGKELVKERVSKETVSQGKS